MLETVPSPDFLSGVDWRMDSPGQKNSSAIGEGIPLSKTGGSAGIPIAQSSVWSPKQNTDPLHDIRTSIQNGSLFKFAESTLANQFGSMHLLGQRVSTSSSDTNSSNSGNSNGNNLNNGRNPSKHQTSESSSTSSMASLQYPVSQASWSTMVQKNPRPIKQARSRPRPAKTFTFTASGCCSSPKIRVICTACNEEHVTKVNEELRPRVIPVATSQLGFCRFCQSNGDPAEVYQSHCLRSDDGKVTCPVLREYNCPICKNGGGDYAHTIKYCPFARKAKP
ncbi:uncharacterized protein LOC111270572 isoform X2 [Varroa jacobsoni]|uniref:Nanos-type domain-containing protein n=1 Tax=Varroa destructor TaxID=109461 RepID=A0A7M7JPK2_VARDE|nr:uncharacterized protein LOC111247792 isoform X2 [Varroa destructor]XP_022706586.1 uncharacterized protein LOC111270572 isoform X2 [Varroa jacobsoni]